MGSKLIGVLLLTAPLTLPAYAETANVAVAANFTTVAEQLAAAYKARNRQ